MCRNVFIILAGIATLVTSQWPLAHAQSEKAEAPRLPAGAPPLRQLPSGLLEIGKVQFDKAKRTIAFDARVNMREGLVEYVLVHETGKIHESLFTTDAQPYHVHLACLFLSGKNEPARDTDITGLLGDNVLVRIRWAADGVTNHVSAEELVLKLDANQPMTPGPWIYNGSRVIDGNFLAQRDGSFVAIIKDPDALINNPRPGRENDEIWQAIPTKMPPLGALVRFSIQLEENGSKPQKSSNE